MTNDKAVHHRDYFLESQRLGFSHWSADDLSLALALWSDAEVTRFIGGPFSRDRVQEKLDRELVFMSAHHVQYWPVFLLSNGEHVGCAGLRPCKPEEKIYELGFHLRPAYWGQGFALEAGRAVVAWAFNTLDARALFAGHHPSNAASRRVLEKLGFQFTHEEFYEPTGLLHLCYLLRHPGRAKA
jgi:RimJ/RimL family protein N-acetyltransferase